MIIFLRPTIDRHDTPIQKKLSKRMAHRKCRHAERDAIESELEDLRDSERERREDFYSYYACDLEDINDFLQYEELYEDMRSTEREHRRSIETELDQNNKDDDWFWHPWHH